ncbi:isoprenoid synthase domain-containing protein [Collybia nuda]|uniref:Terpene synthase n=1 Tax=Collybia nuda TaxID=64659 RepID=A0A9P6CIM5_9AGAR|nr:isoprenoid synthase domain-containing protein [Collybia nuda]
MSPSYQLPDLLSLSRPFELRTNQSCRTVTQASEAWLFALKGSELDNTLTRAELASLSSMKAGLLAALCFPGCDPPQLRFLTDFLTFLILSDQRVRHAKQLPDSGWSEGDVGDKNGFDLLNNHALFQYIIPQMKRLISRAPLDWDTRFTSSVVSYHSAQLQAISNRSNNIVPELEEYMKLRRDLSGLNMIFDLVELTEIAAFTVPDTNLSEKMETLKRLAADIISCSLDVVSFNADQAQGNPHNLITVLVTHKALSLQGAFTFAGALIKDMYGAFAAIEESLLDLGQPTPPQPNHSRLLTLFSPAWTWSPFPSASTPTSPTIPEQLKQQVDSTLSDLHSCVQALKDCVVGTVNWVYETELYFGKKGEEIRTFGWVFLNPKTDERELTVTPIP